MKIKIVLIFFILTSFAQAKPQYACLTSFDNLGIPHVQAASNEEFYYCFGLHHGRDRAWQMDYFRRVALGTASEVLGYDHLKSDLMMRLLDLNSQAKRLWEKFPSDKKHFLEMYTKGVNEGFKTGKKSKEFIDLNEEPSAWKGEHSLLVLLLQSFDQTRKTFFRDYEEELHKERWGLKTASLFSDDDIPWLNTILKEGEYDKGTSKIKTTFHAHDPIKLWNDFPSIFGLESGSNNWVVSGAKSVHGHAMLANDPHLDLKTPVFWYWLSIKSPQMKVIGASLPGVPVIASGTNGKVAWGLTNSYYNSADSILINDLREDDVETIRPMVFFKFGFLKLPFFFKTFEKLKSGERILPLKMKSDKKLVLRWTGFSLSPEDISPLFNVHLATNVQEMDHYLSGIGIPSWNYVFADSKSDIGYRLVGKVFKHVNDIPYGVHEMTYDQFKNQEFLDKEFRPHLMNPKRGYIYTANNRHFPKDSLFQGGRAYTQSFRGFRIDELLSDKQSVESFKNIQCDRQVVDARFLIPKINKYLSDDRLMKWNFIASDESLELPLYRRMLDLVMERWKVNEIALYRLLDNLDEKELKDLRSIYLEAVKEINNRKWSEVLRLGFSHLSKNESWSFAPEISGVGDSHTVDPGTARWNSNKKIYEQYSGASMRMIVELTPDSPRIWLSMPGVNREYDTRTLGQTWEEWRNCQYKEVKF